MCINVSKLSRRIKLLEDGETLIMSHIVFGVYHLRMNPQRNRILHKPIDAHALAHTDLWVLDASGVCHPDRDAMTEGKISEFLLWGYGEWSIYREHTESTCDECGGSGKIPIFADKEEC